MILGSPLSKSRAFVKRHTLCVSEISLTDCCLYCGIIRATYGCRYGRMADCGEMKAGAAQLADESETKVTSFKGCFHCQGKGAR